MLATVGYLLPEDRALAMVDACAKQLATVSTIPDVLKVVTQADAIAAVMQKIKASDEAQKAALRLRVDAEAQLGRITAQIPLGKRGGGAQVNPGQQTKRKVLASNGLHNFRASSAEKLARMPQEEVDAAIDRAKTPGLYGVLNDLGIRKPWREYQSPERTHRDIAYLANEAIDLLERSVASKSPPHAGTVVEYRNRLTRLLPKRAEK